MPSIIASLPARRARLMPMRDGLPPLRRILLVDTEPALAAIVAEWLEPEGWRVESGDVARGAALVIVDVAFPRQAAEHLQRLGAVHAGTPILVLSSTFLGRIDCCGAVARQLGVAGVLPKPLQRDALLGAVQQLAGPAAASAVASRV